MIFLPYDGFAEVFEVKMAKNAYLSSCQENNQCFMPTSTWIAVGDTVQWQNEDITIHNVRSGKGTESNVGEQFNSGEIRPRSIFEINFSETGTFYFHCMYHPWMKGDIVVRDIKNTPNISKEALSISSSNTDNDVLLDTAKQDYTGPIIAIAFLVIVFLAIVVPIIIGIRRFKKNRNQKRENRKKQQEYENSQRRYNENRRRQEEERQRWQQQNNNQQRKQQQQNNNQENKQKQTSTNNNALTRAEALEILGLQEGATKEEIKKAHKEMALKIHPDKHRSEIQKAHANQMMTNINNAFDVLNK